MVTVHISTTERTLASIEAENTAEARKAAIELLARYREKYDLGNVAVKFCAPSGCYPTTGLLFESHVWSR